MFHETLKAVMRDTGFTPETLAEATGIPRDNIDFYLEGLVVPGRARSRLLADALGVRPKDLKASE